MQNPYVVGGEGDVVRREFERIGWEWGYFCPEPDFQHFSLDAAS